MNSILISHHYLQPRSMPRLRPKQRITSHTNLCHRIPWQREGRQNERRGSRRRVQSRPRRLMVGLAILLLALFFLSVWVLFAGVERVFWTAVVFLLAAAVLGLGLFFLAHLVSHVALTF